MDTKILSQISRALLVPGVIGAAIAAVGLLIGMTAAVDLDNSATGVMVILSFFLSITCLGVAGVIQIFLNNRNTDSPER